MKLRNIPVDKFAQKDLGKMQRLINKNPELITTLIKFYINKNIPLSGGKYFADSIESLYNYLKSYKQQLRNYLPSAFSKTHNKL
jgi:hypothetical protein